MGYNILETKEFERNGVDIQLVKSQGSGENSKANWKIKVSDEELDSGKLAEWIGPNRGLFVARALDKVLWLKFDNAPIDRNDDAFFEWLNSDELISTGGGSGNRTGKVKKLTNENEALKALARDKGISEEEIRSVLL